MGKFIFLVDKYVVEVDKCDRLYTGVGTNTVNNLVCGLSVDLCIGGGWLWINEVDM